MAKSFFESQIAILERKIFFKDKFIIIWNTDV